MSQQPDDLGGDLGRETTEVRIVRNEVACTEPVAVELLSEIFPKEKLLLPKQISENLGLFAPNHVLDSSGALETVPFNRRELESAAAAGYRLHFRPALLRNRKGNELVVVDTSLVFDLLEQNGQEIFDRETKVWLEIKGLLGRVPEGWSLISPRYPLWQKGNLERLEQFTGELGRQNQYLYDLSSFLTDCFFIYGPDVSRWHKALGGGLVVEAGRSQCQLLSTEGLLRKKFRMRQVKREIAGTHSAAVQYVSGVEKRLPFL